MDLRSKAEPQVTIRLGREKLNDLVHLAQASRDGLETGGFLFGPLVRGWDREIAVTSVTTMIKERASSSGRRDLEANVVSKSWIRASGADDHFGECGAWHTHPNSRSGEPSERDLQTWLSACDFFERPYVGLILTVADPSDSSRWWWPQVHGWIIRRDDHGRAICQPATVAG